MLSTKQDIQERNNGFTGKFAKGRHDQNSYLRLW